MRASSSATGTVGRPRRFGAARRLRSRQAATRPRCTLVEQMRQRPELRAPRIAGDLQAARDHDPAAARPDGRHGRHHPGDEPGDPRRHPGRDRPGQRPLLAVSDRQVPIRVALNEGSRRNLSTIENMPVPTTSGGSVPLKVVAEISFGAGPSIIQRINQERRIMVGADLAPGVVDYRGRSSTSCRSCRTCPKASSAPAPASSARRRSSSPSS